MLSPINNNLTGLVFGSANNKIELEGSLAKLSSGNKLIRAGDDTGAFSQASKLGAKNKRDLVSLQNLQNLVSYSQSQDGVLEQVGKILHRMNEITVRALDVTASDGDRENYNKEFIELATQLDEMEGEDFNGKKLFGAGSFSDDKKEFIESLKNNWLKASEDLITQQYGWVPDTTDSWDLIVNENDTGGYSAFVRSATYANNTADVLEMQFDLPDFSAPHTQPISTADTTVAHEMVHLMQAQNSYFGDLIGDPLKDDTWIKEGLAEFIAGADNRVAGSLQSNSVQDLINKVGAGNSWGGTSDDYSAAFLAINFLHERITATNPSNFGPPAGIAPGSEGIKHLTTWMKEQHVSGAGSNNSGLNSYLTSFNILNTGGGSYSNNDDFLNDFTSASGGKAWVDNLIINNRFTNTDTGSVWGTDVAGSANRSGTDLSEQDSVPDATGSPQGNFVEEKEESSLAASIDGTGATYDLKSVNTVTISDTATYNLESIASARTTLTQLTSWMENLSSERANIGANTSRLEKEIQNLNGKIVTGEMAISRIQDTDIAKESTQFASNQVRMQASIAILAQAKDLNVGIRDLIRGIMIGQS